MTKKPGRDATTSPATSQATPFERFDNALKQVLSVKKTDLAKFLPKPSKSKSR